jgi:hypothetical protein
MKTLLMLQTLMLIPTHLHGGLSLIGTRLLSRKLGLTLLLDAKSVLKLKKKTQKRNQNQNNL